MDMTQLQQYILPVLIVGFFGWRFVKFKMTKSQIPQLRKRGAVVIDVRSPSEYSGGASEGSINIPLGDLPNRLGGMDREKPVVVCCASGTRSAMAAAILRKNGFKEVVNAGPWANTVEV